MTAVPARKADGYTYRDYLQFPDELRCEIMDGEIFDMTPAPTTGHQGLVVSLAVVLENHLRDRALPCRVFVSPVDVILSEKDVVQPDVVIVCDRSKIRRQGIFGPPDVVFEVLSPSTESKDRRKKKGLFERSGVREYFLANPEAEFVEKYTLTSTGYGIPLLYEGKETFNIEAIGLELTVQDLFPPYRYAEEQTVSPEA